MPGRAPKRTHLDFKVLALAAFGIVLLTLRLRLAHRLPGRGFRPSLHPPAVAPDEPKLQPPPPPGANAQLAEEEWRGVRHARRVHGGRFETVLVTGGLGFIGSHVVELLLARQFGVIILDDESNGPSTTTRRKDN